MNVKVGKNLGNTAASIGNNTSQQVFEKNLMVERIPNSAVKVPKSNKLMKEKEKEDYLEIEDIERELDSAERSRKGTNNMSN